MKKIIIAILVLLPVFLRAQTITYDSNKMRQPVNVYGNDFKGNYRFGTTLLIPRDTVRLSRGDSGAIAYKGGYQWFWNGYTWLQNSTGASTTNWGTTGNVGTTAGTNFIGTTDNIDFEMKRNGLLGAWLDYNPSISLTELNANSVSSLYAFHQGLQIQSGISPTTRYMTFDPSALTGARTGTFQNSSGTFAWLSDIPAASNLQQVTTIGNTTNTGITLLQDISSSLVSSGIGLSSNYNGMLSITQPTYPNSILDFSSIRTINKNYRFPDSSGTIALLQNIPASGISGSGTTNYVPKWTPNGTTLGNSSITDNGSTVTTALPVTATDFKLSSASPYSLLRNIQNSFGGSDSVVIAAGVIRGNASGGGGSFITWTFLDGATSHDKLYFTSVAGVATGAIRITYPTVSKVISFVAVPDETLAGFSMTMGATVDVDHADIFCYIPSMNGGSLTGSGGASWTKSSIISGWDVDYNSSSGLTRFNATNSDGLPSTGSDYSACQITYSGSNPYLIKRAYSALGIYNIGFYLTDILGNPVTGSTNANDVITVTTRPTRVLANGYQVSGSLFESNIWNSSSNIWIIGVFKK